MKVLITPFVDNPYQHILKDKLEEKGVDVIAEEFIPPYLILIEVLRNRPDVLHLNWVDRFYLTDDDILWKNLAAAVIFGAEIFIASFFTKIVWTAHNKHNHENKSPRLDQFMRKYVLWIADSVQVWDENTEKELCNYLGVGSKKMIRIPHGNYLPIHPESELPTKEESREKLGIDSNKKILMFFGNIRRYKQVPKLMREFSSICRDSKLFVVGRVWENEIDQELEKISSNQENIEYIEGFVDEDEIPLYLRSADTIALPFDRIFNSGSVLLSMGMGRTVLAPKKGVLKSIIPDKNITYDTLKEGLEEFRDLDRNIMNDIGEENLIAVKENHDWENIIIKTIEDFYSLN